ncbi:MAG: DUF192 domain-containing protein, partial [Desulfobacteraceae bacterium]
VDEVTWMKGHRTLIRVLFLLALTMGTAHGQDKKPLRVYFPNGEFVFAELALSSEERSRGLMFRDGINTDKGMLFIFEEEATHSFWMKNVKFPIDIIWLDREKRIVHMVKQVPPCKNDPCPTYTPVRPAVYVLELSAGKSDQMGLKPGSRLVW